MISAESCMNDLERTIPEKSDVRGLLRLLGNELSASQSVGLTMSGSSSSWTSKDKDGKDSLPGELASKRSPKSNNVCLCSGCRIGTPSFRFPDNLLTSSVAAPLNSLGCVVKDVFALHILDISCFFVPMWMRVMTSRKQ